MAFPLPDAVLCDNDGLMLDTEEVWTRAERALYERRGIEFTAEHKLELIGTPATIASGIIARHIDTGEDPSTLMTELDQLVLAELRRGADAMPGAFELVADLRAAAVPLALVSNSPMMFIEIALEISGLVGSFDAVISGHETGAPKPAPDPYLAACEALGVEPGPGVIVLEDSPTGVRSGVLAGLTVIGIPSMSEVTLPQAHEKADSLTDPALRARLGLALREAEAEA